MEEEVEESMTSMVLRNQMKSNQQIEEIPETVPSSIFENITACLSPVREKKEPVLSLVIPLSNSTKMMRNSDSTSTLNAKMVEPDSQISLH